MTTRFSGPPAVEIPAPDQARLLELARTAVAVAAGARPAGALEAALAGGPLPDFPTAAFVTLLVHGDLRGCMGTLDPGGPAWSTVTETARWAATRDPRFRALDARELEDMEIDVSILGPLVPLEDPASFRPGIDGIVIERDGRRGLLLPEVADQVGHGPTAMLDAVCRKAGLHPGAWREPGSLLWVFRTLRFGGPAT